jgi:hypothetical protein
MPIPARSHQVSGRFDSLNTATSHGTSQGPKGAFILRSSVGCRPDEIDVDELMARLSKMTDEALLRFGRAAAYMCSSKANYHEPR